MLKFRVTLEIFDPRMYEPIQIQNSKNVQVEKNELGEVVLTIHAESSNAASELAKLLTEHLYEVKNVDEI